MADLDPLHTDHDYLRDLRSCLQRSPHLDILVGLMHGRGVRFVHVEGSSANGARWASIVVQGEPDVTVLRAVAAAIESHLTEERLRLRERGLQH